MPARAGSAVSSTAALRPSRVSKEKARVTIKAATDPKFKSPRSSGIRVEGPPRRILSPTSSPVIPPVDSGITSSEESPWEGLQRQHTQRIDRDDLMDSIEKRIRETVTDMFASRDEEQKKNFATTAAVRVPGRYRVEGTTSPTPPVFALPVTAASRNILSRWPWVEKDTVDLIARGEFDIDGLPKLHRTDELRNAYLKKSLKGVYQPLEGGPAEVIIGTTKLQSSFKESTSFFLAWHTYMSIRTAFEPSRASGLIIWTERLFYFIHLNYPWHSILEYVIAYFQRYQNTLPDDWFNPDSTLISYHLTLSQQKPLTATSQRSNASKVKLNPGQKASVNSDEVCVMFNRPSGCTWRERRGTSCPHRHVCLVCMSREHTSLMCTGKPAK